jgi:hydrogenase expression/formation protein HypE
LNKRDGEFILISNGTKVKPGDKIITNGTLGDHAIAILAQRESLKFETPVKSDCAALNHLIKKALDVCTEIAFMRDATRGGMATVACELASKINMGILLDENSVPVNESVQAICEIFGFDPLFLANEGKVMIVAPQDKAEIVVAELKKDSLGQNAAIIGEITSENAGKVILKTTTGGKRILDVPAGAQLPRIC